MAGQYTCSLTCSVDAADSVEHSSAYPTPVFMHVGSIDIH